MEKLRSIQLATIDDTCAVINTNASLLLSKCPADVKIGSIQGFDATQRFGSPADEAWHFAKLHLIYRCLRQP